MQSVPFAIANLRALLDKPYPEYPYLTSMLSRLVAMKQFEDIPGKRPLVVKSDKFRFIKGIPNDALRQRRRICVRLPCNK